MSVLWYTIPIAIALALSVFPIAAVLLLLLAPDPLARSVPFAVGTVLGIGVLVAAFALGASLVPTTAEGETPRWTHVVEIALGACLIVAGIVLAFRKNAPATDESARIAAVTDRLTPRRAFGFGLLMNVRPKSILLTIAAGVAIGTAPIDPLAGGVAIIVFAVISGSVVVGLVITYAIGKTRVRPGLERLRVSLMSHAGLLLWLLLLLLGVVLVVLGAVQLAQ